MYEYNPKLIKTHTWPPPQQLPSGRWRRVWTIRLREVLSTSTTIETLAIEITQEVFEDLAALDSRLENLKDELAISLELASPQEIILALITEEDAWPEEILIASWRLFQAIDEMLGTIDTIEGQARDNWPPWNLLPEADESS